MCFLDDGATVPELPTFLHSPIEAIPSVAARSPPRNIRVMQFSSSLPGKIPPFDIASEGILNPSISDSHTREEPQL